MLAASVGKRPNGGRKEASKQATLSAVDALKHDCVCSMELRSQDFLYREFSFVENEK